MSATPLAPRVSVLMAVHNGERYVRQAMESILGQRFADFEFLIINDGSTDRTREIVLSYADARIELVENERNLGLAASLNRGLRRARGEFVARQDADDVSEPRRLEKQVAFLDAHPEVALLGTWYKVIDSHGTRRGEMTPPCEWLDLRWTLFFGTPFVHSSVIMRRARVLDAVGGYAESLRRAQDYELWNRIARVFPVANLSEFLVRYRTHSASISATIGRTDSTFDRLRAANIGRLLAWEEREVEQNESRRRAMTALHFGWEDGVEPDRLLQAADDLLTLQRAFSQEVGLTNVEATRHRCALRARIGRHLVLLARTSRSADLAQRRELLRRAFHLHRAVYLWPRTIVRTGIALLRGILQPANGSRSSAAARV